jgi:anaerobic selenocysteine-containing dehydrogenase
VFMSPADAETLHLSEGDELVLENQLGRFRGHVHLSPVKPGNLQVHWPEGQVLIAGDSRHRGKRSGIPDYNAFVRVQPAAVVRDRDDAARTEVEARAATPPSRGNGEPRAPFPPPVPQGPGPQPPGTVH